MKCLECDADVMPGKKRCHTHFVARRRTLQRNLYEQQKLIPGSKWRDHNGKWRKPKTEVALKTNAKANAKKKAKLDQDPDLARREKDKVNAKRRAKRAVSGTCEICAKGPMKLNRDHDHETGKRRGTLCTRCNLLLGFVKDSEEMLLTFIAYLKKYRQNTGG